MFCCLGWGSLIWDPQSLPFSGRWAEDGPPLPIEFARESSDGRITLVVCDGVQSVAVLWTLLNVQTLDEAKRALAFREGISHANTKYSIGWSEHTNTSEHPEATEICRWAEARGIEGVVWTALKPKIGVDYRVPTLHEVIAHLESLQGTKLRTAEEYIRRAPRQIITPYREGIERALGWTPA